MKKFVISFRYKEFLLTANVMLNRSGNVLLYSIVFPDTTSEQLLENKTFCFMEDIRGFKLLMLNTLDCSFEVLDWKIKFQTVDKPDIQYPEVFSLS